MLDMLYEVKSMVTVIRGELDVTMRKKRTKKEYLDTLEAVREEVESLQLVIESLFRLSQKPDIEKQVRKR